VLDPRRRRSTTASAAGITAITPAIPISLPSIRPAFRTVTIRAGVYPAGNPFDSMIAAEISGLSEEDRSPARSGEARRRAGKGAARAHPIATPEISLMEMRTVSDDACGDTKDVATVQRSSLPWTVEREPPAGAGAVSGILVRLVNQAGSEGGDRLIIAPSESGV
jgi:hypothetical protein